MGWRHVSRARRASTYAQKVSLELIVGPPNSGREGRILERLEAARDRSPVLVVPTADDAARFERDLCTSGGGGVIGVSIRTFGSLFDEVARLAGLALPAPLSAPQRLALVRAAVRATDLRLLRRSSERPGFAPALAALIAELQSAMVSPADLEHAVADLDDADYAGELAALYAAYVGLLESAERSDAGSRAPATIAALAADPALWDARPVFFYGFDDLTRAQLELLAALDRAAEVVVAVNFEDRDALNARARLHAQMVEELGGSVAEPLAHRPSHTERASLRHLDRSLFEPGAERLALDEGVRMLECAGELGEAEAIGAEVAALIAAGEPADSIAIVVRDPDRRGSLIGRVLERLAIPVAVEAGVPLATTAVGGSVVALCRAVSEDDPAELLAHLRADPSTPPGVADALELRLNRAQPATIDEAISGWEAPPRHLATLRGARSAAARMHALAAIAHELATAVHGEQAPLAGRAAADHPTPFDPVEQRAAIAIAELCEELAEVGGLPACDPPGLRDAADAIESATVRLWRGPTDGRVRVLDPYRIRAGRARYLFCAGLQEGEFPRRSPGDPLLGDERRRRLGIEALVRRDPLDEERYLFHACVSRPTERLTLSWQFADDDGAPAARSPFVDEVLDLLGESTQEAAKALIRRRGIEQVTFAAAEAPTERELARAQALAGPRAREVPPGPLRVPAVLEGLAERELLSASTLEQWLECPYRWFVEHELSPQRLVPESDPLRLGSIAHDALEALYAEPPGTDSIARPGDLGRWRERLAELLDQVARDHGMRPDRPRDAVALARLREQVEAFLAEEARLEIELRPRRDLLEADFGTEENGAAALDLGGAKLRGRIDRVDLAPDGTRALIRDYKTGRSMPGRRGWEGKGKLQLQLYLLAARESLGLDPVGGLYYALGEYRDRRPRGMVLADEAVIGDLAEHLVGGDSCGPDEFDEELERARGQASEQAAAMRAGDIGRRPLGGKCPTYCTFQPICRLERAVGLEAAEGRSAENGVG